MVRFCVSGFSSKPFSAFFGILGYVQCILLLNLWPLLSQVKEVSLYVNTCEMWEQNIACGWLSRCLSGKGSTCNTGDVGSTPGSGRSPGEGNGNPLQHSCLENAMNRGAWWATVYGVTKSWTWLSAHACARTHTHTHTHTQSLWDHSPFWVIIYNTYSDT